MENNSRIVKFYIILLSNRLPSKVVDVPSLSVFKRRLDNELGDVL